MLRDPEIISGITDTSVKICKLFKSSIDYPIPGKRWRLPIAKFSIKFKPANLHPASFCAVTLITEHKLGIFHSAPTVIVIFKDVRGNIQFGPGFRNRRSELGTGSPLHGTGHLLGKFCQTRLSIHRQMERKTRHQIALQVCNQPGYRASFLCDFLLAILE